MAGPRSAAPRPAGGAHASSPANRAVPSGANRSLAGMKRAISIVREHVLEAADLVVDFATLGEYGIEPEPVPDCERRPSVLASGAPPTLHERAGTP